MFLVDLSVLSPIVYLSEDTTLFSTGVCLLDFGF